jgi:hypothetical protein
MRRVNRQAARAESAAELARQCDEWNSAYPVGTLVEYHPIIDEPEHRLRKTRTAAQVLSGHTAVVWLEDERGCVCLEACVPVAAV